MPLYQLDDKYHFDNASREIVNQRTGHSIPADEPRMIFRAQDKCTVEMLMAYLEACIAQDASPEHIQTIRERIEAFARWQLANPDKVKVPD